MKLFNPEIELDRYAEEYRKTGVTVVDNWLDADTAEAIHKCLCEEVPWYVYTSLGIDTQDIPEADWNAMPPDERERLTPELPTTYTHFRSKTPFVTIQNRFAIKRCLDKGEFVPPLLEETLRELNDEPYLERLRQLVGDDDVHGVSCAASWYKPGHFVTAHKDHADNKFASHLIGLSRDWKENWGGRFTTCDNWGMVKNSVVPKFNSLILAKPQILHYVTQVTQDAGSHRLTLYGWAQRHKHI